ncbi:hypothetical protein BFP76_14320 [Amylibacter kogurei]|uniref:Uncharacterized protein n=1 Tax=Paramylibacter kogurei TaxID=1889778 RepID=A0A2G5K9A3_9RHOB|nr:DUF6173 family protein [Amylibacter kogurei]PIB26128.1 hypothetical protein BFP76_14320 [Amylibacter kogurei]
MSEEIKTTAEAIEAAALPEAYAVHVDKQGNVISDKAKGIAKKSLAEKSPAEWAYERIVMYIQKFEETLNSNEEVGMGFAAGHVGSLRIQGMGFFAPDMVTFYGEDGEGNAMQLVQHVSQLNVMLVAEQKTGEPEAAPQRIGFKLAEDLEEAKKG